MRPCMIRKPHRLSEKAASSTNATNRMMALRKNAHVVRAEAE